MDKTKIAENLIQLYSDYKELLWKHNYAFPKREYIEAVSQAILSLNNVEEEGAE